MRLLVMTTKRDNPKYCNSCSCKSGSSSPSPEAIAAYYEFQKLNNMTKAAKSQGVRSAGGCAWFINSAEHNYCFWKYAEDLVAPVKDKEICHLLGLTQQELKEIYNSAIQKLQANKSNPDVALFIEGLREKIQKDHEQIVTQHEVCVTDIVGPESADGEEKLLSDIDKLANNAPVKKRGRPPRFGNQPMHRSGKRVDLYGIYSPAKLAELKKKGEQVDKRKRKKD